MFKHHHLLSLRTLITDQNIFEPSVNIHVFMDSDSVSHIITDLLLLVKCTGKYFFLRKTQPQVRDISQVFLTSVVISVVVSSISWQDQERVDSGTQ